ncbi:MAG: deoxyribonuclease IV [Microlunatus sp.]|nr:deoxyribonuclease IV [Microlunatus sp.]MDN5770182.1 deoxyribonuclease IV [Microlunatus sp.]MDN5803288.1 deoxyribonuclease IV [Microlunatus sp.]
MSTHIRIGGHGEQQDPIAEARARRADLAQFFLGDPQGWKGPEFAYEGGAAALKAAAIDADIALYVHAPYVLNVATTNNRIRIPSRKFLQQYLNAAAEIGAAGVVVHGGHVLKSDDPEKGFDNWRKCIDGLDLAVPLLIENTAGGGQAMARRLERIERLWDAVTSAAGSDDVGFCLDTCHAHAGGIELADVVQRIHQITGRIDLVHANDSRDDFDSGADRHANLGDGEIAPDDLLAVVAAAGAPVVVETPGGREGQAADIAWLRARLATDSTA